jgi:DNA-binding transcriptional ArsR family regulator
MNAPATVQTTANHPPLIPLKTLLPLVGSPVRWQILRELSAGEPLEVTELGKRVGLAPDAASKQLTKMRQAGILVQGRGKLYRIAEAYLPTPGQPVVDFGSCLLRLDVGA